MSTVYGRKIGTDSTLGVKCDICGEIYWTDLTGQSFPDHVREAVQHGWKNTKQNGKWLNLCPECDEYLRKQKRETKLAKDCTGCRWVDRPQKCSCCKRNQNLKDCYEEAWSLTERRNGSDPGRTESRGQTPGVQAHQG